MKFDIYNKNMQLLWKYSPINHSTVTYTISLCIAMGMYADHLGDRLWQLIN